MWSSPHRRDASSHIIWCIYIYPIRSYWHFSEIQDGERRHLEFVWVCHGTTHEPNSWCVPPVKISSWLAKLFSSYKDLNFSSFRLESPIHAPTISVFEGFYLQNFRGISFRPPEGTSLLGTTRFEPSLVQIWRNSATCGLGKENKKKQKERKKDSGKLAIRPDHPRRCTEVKVCMPGGLRCVVLNVKFYYNRFSGCAAVGGRKSPFIITLAIGLYNSLYYRTSDVVCHQCRVQLEGIIIMLGATCER